MAIPVSLEEEGDVSVVVVLLVSVVEITVAELVGTGVIATVALA
jgi:hypothetical protein